MAFAEPFTRIGLPQRDLVLSAVQSYYAKRLIGWRQRLFLLAPVLTIGLAGCAGNRLPACVVTAPAAEEIDKIPKLGNSNSSGQVLVGIDGSGSMQGFMSSDTSEWGSMLQSVKLALNAQNLQIKAYRVGGSYATPLGDLNQARSACFFQGCGSFSPVASSLHTIWELPQASSTKNSVPLRLMISDLEVNDTDVNGLVRAIKPDIRKGAIIGVLGVKLPFAGSIYNNKGISNHNGKGARPLYILSSGNASSVQQLLSDVRINLGLKGVQTQGLHISILGRHGKQPLMARVARGNPANNAISGLPISLAGSTFSPGMNPEYQLVKLVGGGGILRIETAPDLGKGVSAPTSLMNLDAIPLPRLGKTGVPDGVSLLDLSVSGQNISVELRIDKSQNAGVFRMIAPAGSLPDEWWLRWNQSKGKNKEPLSQTDGLLLALTSLNQTLMPKGAPPDASLCVAYSHNDTNGGGEGSALAFIIPLLLVASAAGAFMVVRNREEDD